MDWVMTLKSFGFPALLSGFLIYNELKSKRRLEARVEKLEEARVEVLLGAIQNNTAALKALEVTLHNRPCISEVKK